MVVNGNQSISKATMYQLLNKSVWRSAIFLTVSLCSLCNLTACHSTLPHTVFLLVLAVLSRQCGRNCSPTTVTDQVKS